ncbi:MAG: SOS response-associated peptidase [Phototrophicales bacterium]
MCGRFTLTADTNDLQQAFDLQSIPATITARYNIAPTQPVAVIANDAPHDLTFFQWGLVPSWAKDMSIASKLINARAETLHEKPSFRSAYKRRRCLIPANGFYEWAKTPTGKKPMYIHLKDHQVFAFAGLWESWHSPDGDELRSCTIITTTPNDLIKPLHHRMAVILNPADYDLWLSGEELPPDMLVPLLKPYPSDEMIAYEVSPLVNNVANDTPDLIQPYHRPTQGMMF